MQKISQDIEETYENREDSLKEVEIQEDRESRNKFINEELKKLQEMLTKRKEELEGLCKKNSVTIEEIKEITEVLNHGDQYIIENEEHLGTSQAVPMNIRSSVKVKKKKKAYKQRLARERKNYMMSLG
jgi:hypothetical protein